MHPPITRAGRRRFRRVACIACAAIAVGWTGWRVLRPPAHAAFVPADPVLRSAPLYFYPAPGAPRAVVVFFGNDVGFWHAHQQLAERLAAAGDAVVGVDVRPLLDALPDGPAPRRADAFLTRVGPLLARARAAVGGTGRPLVLAGHSFGAELALWTAVRLRPPGLAGVLALGPGARGHLRITLADLAERGEPEEPGSFAVADQVRALAPGVRVAVVRGAHDRFGSTDVALVAAGARRFSIPLAGHAMRRLLIAGPVVHAALDWLLAARAAPSPRRTPAWLAGA